MTAKRQGRKADERTVLRNVPILADIDDEHLDQLARVVDRRHVPADEWLFREGDPSDSIYIVDSGRFAAVGADGQLIREMGSGDSIGELGVIAGAGRSASVRALRDSVVWRIAADSFTEVLTTTPKLQSVMLQAMATMLRESRSANVSRRPRVIGVLSTGDAAALPIVDAIATQLSVHGQTTVVAPPVDTTADVSGYGELVEAFSEILDRAERSNDWVLLVADRGSGDLWRRFVAAQSDRLVVLVDEPYPPNGFDSLIAQRPVHLVACMAEPDTSWWDLLQPLSHHPLSDEGIGALARRIAGRSLGLVMAGGGAWGLAHFGVYDELTRAGVVIDRFAGTSAGAIAAAAFALGMDAPEGIATARRYLADSNVLGDYTVPAVAFIRGARVDHLVEVVFGGTLIEHLAREFFSVSADLVTGDQVIHRRGPLSLAVRASISIPGLIPPVRQGEQLLVDGGILNNLPADVMCADSDGEVICVDLRRKFTPSKSFGLLPPIFQPPGFVRRLLTGTDVALPPLQETMLRALDLAASTANLRDFPRIAAIIEPDVSAIGVLDFKKLDAAVAAGRAAARAVLEAQPDLVR
ncbi:patatin-like phospholipase family protein [Mycobacterium haemophilum]|uniref:Esterase n=1 Tax=Mycobacterium haemophilum TaxID=29311 RepID=A0A0I9TDF2_9MYCO|nr:patatin-like phospholipase family protein [Mycobacterium haemophilum]AKN17147.1 esterase [Mycobacterium haemophilum DSM 44634]KLO27361.1 esterase [Mycobacterium haemophilum]KLO35056.1 esterase [Mycobacterium haemophilum]KLO40001.1 esterase [Mycobacterium haemophilum]KLO47331.1 esterase [Mycobacterium haemophilum]